MFFRKRRENLDNQTNHFIANLARELVQSGLATWSNIRGCSEKEIEQLERHFDIKLPSLYKDFLRQMGKEAGRFMRGEDVFYGFLFGNREAIEEVLELDGHPFPLKKEDFIFHSHQGCFFYYFNTADNDPDPFVCFYNEGDLKYEITEDRYSEFLLILLRQAKEHQER